MPTLVALDARYGERAGSGQSADRRSGDVRPLTDPGRMRRLGPFAAVAAFGLVLAALPPQRSPAAVAAAALVTLGIVVIVPLFPWRRWSADWEAAPAFAYLAVVALLRGDGGAGGAGFALLGLLPVVWLALFHRVALLVAGLAGLIGVCLIPVLFSSSLADPYAELRRLALLATTCAVLSVTVHLRFARSRRDARRLATLTREARRDRDFTGAVLDTAGFFVVVVDVEGRITVFNRACEEITGCRAEDVIGQPFWEVTQTGLDPERLTEAFASLSVDDFPGEYENDWTGPKGVHRRIAWRNTALVDESGQLTHIINTGIDVTEQRRTERLFSDVLAAATEQAIMATDPAGTITVFNAGAERLLGYSADEVIGSATLATPHLPAELADRAEALGVPPGPEALFAVARAGEPETRDWTYVRADGGRVAVALTVSAMRDGMGNITGYLGVARDVTREREAVDLVQEAYERERLAAARLRELDRVRSDLVATVSHELRTPLTSILGNVEMLSDGDAGMLTQPQTRLLSAVERNARRLLALIEDLLMLSRIESGAVKINARPVLARTVVGGALEALEPVRARRGVAVAVEVPADPVLIYGDHDQLERIIINLVDNALKFTPPGGSARVQVARVDGQVQLTVADTGMGIPPEEIDHVFERFFRSSLSQERASQGSGLGLAITKSIVERHGGRIWAQSEPGAGTEVVCLLPAPPDGGP